MESNDYFTSYEEWHSALSNVAGITLSEEYCAERVRVLENTSDSSTKDFIKLYGIAYRDKVIDWFKRASP